jgi:hypothetical protein
MPALTNRELLDAEFAAELQGEQLDLIEAENPGFTDRIGMSSVIAQELDMEFDTVFQNYEAIAKEAGHTGDPKIDKGFEAARIRAHQEVSEPGTLKAWFNSAVRGGIRVGQFGDAIPLLKHQGDIDGLNTLRDRADGIIKDANTEEFKKRQEEVDLYNDRRDAALLGFMYPRKIDPNDALAWAETTKKDIDNKIVSAEKKRDEQIIDWVGKQAALLKVPMSSRLAEFKSEEGGLGLLLNPATFTEILVEEMIATTPSLAIMAGGTAAGGPLTGAAAGGLTVYAQGVGANFFAYLSDNNIDTSNQEAVRNALSDKEFYSDAIDYSMTKSAPEAIAAALSMGVANKGNAIFNALVVQPGLGGVGAAAGNIVVGEDIDMKDFVLEMVMELPGGSIEVISQRLLSKTPKFDELMNQTARPPSNHDIQKMVENTSLEEVTRGMSEEEALLIEKQNDGDLRAEKLSNNLVLSQRNLDEIGVGTEWAPPRDPVVIEAEPVLELAQGIQDARTELETNRDVEEDIGDVPTRGAQPDKDGTLEERIAQKEAREEAKKRKALQEELDEVNDEIDVSLSEATPEETAVGFAEDKLNKTDEKAVSDLLNHLSGQGKRLKPTRLATVRERIRGSRKLAAFAKKQLEKLNKAVQQERTRADVRVFAKDEKIANLNERMDQVKNDAAFKLRATVRKLRKDLGDKVKQIKTEMSRNKISTQQANRDQAASISEAIKQVEKLRDDLNKRLPKEDRIKGPSVKELPQKRTLESLEKILDKKIEALESAFTDAVIRVKKKQVKQFVKAFEKDQSAAKKAKKKSKYTAESSENINDYLTLLGLTKDSDKVRADAVKELNKLDDRIDQSENAELTEDENIVVERALTPLLSDNLTEAQVDEILANIKSLDKDGITKRRAEILAEERKIKSVSGTVTTEVSARNSDKGLKVPQEVRALETTFGRLKRRLKYDLLDYRSVSAMLTGKLRSKLEDLVFEPIARAFSDGVLEQQKFTDSLHAKAKALKIDMSSLGTTQLTTIGTRAMSIHEAMFVYGHSQNSRGRTHLKGTTFGGLPINGEVTEMISNVLPQKYKDFVDAIIDHMDNDVYPRLNEIYKKRFGVNMPKEERYLPIKGLNEVSAGSNVFSDHMQYAGFKLSNQKLRTGAKVGWGGSNLDLISSVMSNIANTEHVIATYDAVRRADKVMSSKGVRAELSKRDPDIIKWVNKYLKGVARGTFEPPSGALVEAASHLRQNTAASLTAINVASWAKTLAPLIAVKKDVDLGAWTSTMADMPNYSNMYDTAKTLSTFMAGRRHTNKIEVAELAEGMNRGMIIPGMEVSSQIAAKYKQTTQKFKEWGWSIYGALDGFSTTLAWTAKFKEQINQHGDLNLAISEADRIVKVYFPSGRIDQLPLFFSSGGLERQLTTFTADMNRMLNLGFTGQQLKTGKVREAVLFVAFPAVLSSFYLAGTDFLGDSLKEVLGLREKDEEKDKQYWQDTARYITSQFVGGVPIVGQAIEGKVAQVVGDDAAAWYLGQSNMVFTSTFKDIHKGNYISAFSKASGAPGANYWAYAADKYLKSIFKEEEAEKDSSLIY